MKKTLFKYEGNKAFFYGRNGWEFLGENNMSLGPYGNSSGIFARAETTTPVNEWASKNNIQLFLEKNLKPIPPYL